MTKCLDLDTGNTRAKWRLDDRSGWLLSPRLPDVSERESRIRVSNIAGDFKVIEGWLYETYGIRPEFAETKATMAGVTCGYLEPAKLGIDRWLGIIAAWNKTLVNCVVIGIGTALSVDFATGGNAEVIFSHMDCAIVKEPELVLDGLNLALP